MGNSLCCKPRAERTEAAAPVPAPRQKKAKKKKKSLRHWFSKKVLGRRSGGAAQGPPTPVSAFTAEQSEDEEDEEAMWATVNKEVVPRRKMHVQPYKNKAKASSSRGPAITRVSSARKVVMMQRPADAAPSAVITTQASLAAIVTAAQTPVLAFTATTVQELVLSSTSTLAKTSCVTLVTMASAQQQQSSCIISSVTSGGSPRAVTTLVSAAAQPNQLGSCRSVPAIMAAPSALPQLPRIPSSNKSALTYSRNFCDKPESMPEVPSSLLASSRSGLSSPVSVSPAVVSKVPVNKMPTGINRPSASVPALEWKSSSSSPREVPPVAPVAPVPPVVPVAQIAPVTSVAQVAPTAPVPPVAQVAPAASVASQSMPTHTPKMSLSLSDISAACTDNNVSDGATFVDLEVTQAATVTKATPLARPASSLCRLEGRSPRVNSSINCTTSIQRSPVTSTVPIRLTDTGETPPLPESSRVPDRGKTSSRPKSSRKRPCQTAVPGPQCSTNIDTHMSKQPGIKKELEDVVCASTKPVHKKEHARCSTKPPATCTQETSNTPADTPKVLNKLRSVSDQTRSILDEIPTSKPSSGILKQESMGKITVAPTTLQSRPAYAATDTSAASALPPPTSPQSTIAELKNGQTKPLSTLASTERMATASNGALPPAQNLIDSKDSVGKYHPTCQTSGVPWAASPVLPSVTKVPKATCSGNDGLNASSTTSHAQKHENNENKQNQNLQKPTSETRTPTDTSTGATNGITRGVVEASSDVVSKMLSVGGLVPAPPPATTAAASHKQTAPQTTSVKQTFSVVPEITDSTRPASNKPKRDTDEIQTTREEAPKMQLQRTPILSRIEPTGIEKTASLRREKTEPLNVIKKQSIISNDDFAESKHALVNADKNSAHVLDTRSTPVMERGGQGMPAPGASNRKISIDSLEIDKGATQTIVRSSTSAARPKGVEKAASAGREQLNKSGSALLTKRRSIDSETDDSAPKEVTDLRKKAMMEALFKSSKCSLEKLSGTPTPARASTSRSSDPAVDAIIRACSSPDNRRPFPLAGHEGSSDSLPRVQSDGTFTRPDSSAWSDFKLSPASAKNSLVHLLNKFSHLSGTQVPNEEKVPPDKQMEQPSPIPLDANYAPRLSSDQIHAASESATPVRVDPSDTSQGPSVSIEDLNAMAKAEKRRRKKESRTPTPQNEQPSTSAVTTPQNEQPSTSAVTTPQNEQPSTSAVTTPQNEQPPTSATGNEKRQSETRPADPPPDKPAQKDQPKSPPPAVVHVPTPPSTKKKLPKKDRYRQFVKHQTEEPPAKLLVSEYELPAEVKEKMAKSSVFVPSPPRVVPPHMYQPPVIARDEDAQQARYQQVENQLRPGPWMNSYPKYKANLPSLAPRLLSRAGGSIERLQQNWVLPQDKQIETIKLEYCRFPGLRVPLSKRSGYSVETDVRPGTSQNEEDDENDSAEENTCNSAAYLHLIRQRYRATAHQDTVNRWMN